MVVVVVVSPASKGCGVWTNPSCWQQPQKEWPTDSDDDVAALAVATGWHVSFFDEKPL
jgi:hypothetical protein